MTITLTPAGDARSDGRQQYEPIAARISRVSQYDASTFGFDDLPGFWRWNGMPPLQVGSSYVLHLATKPKPAGPNTRAGAQYMDIDACEPLTPENCPPGFEMRYDEHGAAHGYSDGSGPQQDAPVSSDPETLQRASTATTAPPTPVSGDYRDPTRASIERQVVAKEYGAMLVALHGMKATREIAEGAGAKLEPWDVFNDLQVAYIRDQWFRLCYLLDHGTEAPDYAADDAAADAAHDANAEAV